MFQSIYKSEYCIYSSRRYSVSRPRKFKKQSKPLPKPENSIRIAKFIARCNLCSRRAAEKWIEEGRVVVDGKVVKTPAFNITAENIVSVDGTQVTPPPPRLFLHYKRPGVLVQHNEDKKGRPVLFNIFKEQLKFPELISVGRLDYMSEGLILLTNDGELARYFELPQNGIERVYHVFVQGILDKQLLDNLKDGIAIGKVTYGPVKVVVKKEDESKLSKLEITLNEGKNREIRRIMSYLGLKVNRLVRVKYGEYKLGDLKLGDVQEVKLPKKMIKKTNPAWSWFKNQVNNGESNEGDEDIPIADLVNKENTRQKLDSDI
eukprot:TRINITY_DN2445_c0_g1_i1.p1 TRINITY_DN2445_c0_g1~~TRINITY_DN2445_c0_g1_i1.p1  ORF type:complete len:318 (+),score=31.75 TRINITY_DN2445_c0_g1_i1:131-1084(+)